MSGVERWADVEALTPDELAERWAAAERETRRAWSKFRAALFLVGRRIERTAYPKITKMYEALADEGLVPRRANIGRAAFRGAKLRHKLRCRGSSGC